MPQNDAWKDHPLVFAALASAAISGLGDKGEMLGFIILVVGFLVYMIAHDIVEIQRSSPAVRFFSSPSLLDLHPTKSQLPWRGI